MHTEEYQRSPASNAGVYLVCRLLSRWMYLWLEMHFRVQVALGTLCIMRSPLELSSWIQAAAESCMVALTRGRPKPWRSFSLFLVHPVSSKTLYSVEQSETKEGPGDLACYKKQVYRYSSLSNPLKEIILRYVLLQTWPFTSRLLWI